MTDFQSVSHFSFGGNVDPSGYDWATMPNKRRPNNGRKAGRPPLILSKVTLDDAETGEPREMTRADAIVSLLRRGTYTVDAAAAVGIHTSTIRDWIARGDEHRTENPTGTVPAREKPYVAFTIAVEKAKAQAVVVALDVIRSAANAGQWQAAAWYLERTRPAQYARREQREISGPGGGPITLLDLEREVLEAGSDD